ncbi:MAG: hypothetical protein EOO62_03410 [Hymenobacter sp.]|nr:MAG: hypothetical protein EOO62_03410 [Hymenobacter sp.]
MAAFDTPPAILHLTACVRVSTDATTYTGYVLELDGFPIQATSLAGLLQQLVADTSYLLHAYQRAEGYALLRAQGHEVTDVGQPLAFFLMPEFESV